MLLIWEYKFFPIKLIETFFFSKFDKGYGKGFKTLHIFVGNTRKYQLSNKVFNESNNYLESYLRVKGSIIRTSG